MTNNECKLLQLIETAGISFARIARAYDKTEKLTPYNIYMLKETVIFVKSISEALDDVIK